MIKCQSDSKIASASSSIPHPFRYVSNINQANYQKRFKFVPSIILQQGLDAAELIRLLIAEMDQGKLRKQIKWKKQTPVYSSV